MPKLVLTLKLLFLVEITLAASAIIMLGEQGVS